MNSSDENMSFDDTLSVTPASITTLEDSSTTRSDSVSYFMFIKRNHLMKISFHRIHQFSNTSINQVLMTRKPLSILCQTFFLQFYGVVSKTQKTRGRNVVKLWHAFI